LDAERALSGLRAKRSGHYKRKKKGSHQFTAAEREILFLQLDIQRVSYLQKRKLAFAHLKTEGEHAVSKKTGRLKGGRDDATGRGKWNRSQAGDGDNWRWP